jgi:predicted nicotinamide N-methyase
MPPSVAKSEARVAALAAALPRRVVDVVAGGATWRLATLDDLDDAIERLGPSLGLSASEVCPHFGVVWPAAVALADVLASQLTSTAAHRAPSVLELGCGLALPSLVARRCGASHVVATDRHPLFPLFLRENAARHGIRDVVARLFDWRKDVPESLGRFDLVVGSDLLYEPWQPGFLAATLPRLLSPGGTALIADPGRRHVDAFVRLVEGAGGTAELVAMTPVRHGGRTVDVLLLRVQADAR